MSINVTENLKHEILRNSFWWASRYSKRTDGRTAMTRLVFAIRFVKAPKKRGSPARNVVLFTARHEFVTWV
jgi:hypothetical protein